MGCEGSVRILIVDIEVLALVQQDQVIITVPIHVSDANTASRTSALVGEDAGTSGERLSEGESGC